MVRLLIAAMILGSSVAATSAAAALCRGDCNGDGEVITPELRTGVEIGLAAAPYRLCPPADRGDGAIAVEDLVASVDAKLHGCPATVELFAAPAGNEVAGPRENGRGVLPNGRRVEPAGTQIPVETFPLNLALTPDGQHLLVTNDGWGNEEGERGLQIVDLASGEVSLTEVPHFFGLAVEPGGERVYLSDGDAGVVRRLGLQDGQLAVENAEFIKVPGPATSVYPTALALSPDAHRLHLIGLRDNTLRTYDLQAGGAPLSSIAVGNFPYSVVLSADGKRAYVSSWGLNGGNPVFLVPRPLPPLDPNRDERSSVALVDLADPAQPRVVRYAPIARSLAIDNQKIFGGPHPSAMALSPDGRFLYVTATNVDLLVVLDAATLAPVAEAQLNVFESGPLADQLQGLHPNALAVSPDGQRVYIADAGINAVQVVEVAGTPATFTPIGFIPVGWYPTALALRSDGTLFVANGKGAGIGANGAEVIDINQIVMSSTPYYIGRLVKGSISVIENVGAYDLAAGSEIVRSANGFAPTVARWVEGAPAAGEVQRRGPVPVDFGSGPSSAIKHVVFILKENRTYDQVFGDLEGANGDPRLTLFGEQITPNHHALAREFAFGDNFYNDAEVSIPGHEWTDQGNSTDFTEKLWPRDYNGLLPEADVQQGQEGFAKGGYIFEALERRGVPFRVYGEAFAFLSRFAAGIDGAGAFSTFEKLIVAFGDIGKLVNSIGLLLAGDIQGLRDRGVDVDLLTREVWPNQMLDYPSNILPEKTDVGRAELFETELARFEAEGRMPAFIFLWLPNDHTFGASPRMPTPDSAVADNDAGLGRLVEALSHSSFWPDMAIFVTEDDAQDGQDHVSAHRTIGMVISPWAKHGYVSPVHHSNVSMLKTMELILGVPPRSQYDRYATDMRDYFVTEPDVTPFVARAQRVKARTNPEAEDAPNALLRQAAELSEETDFEMYDMAGENLSRILWLVHEGQQVEVEKAARTRLFAFGFAAMGLLAAMWFTHRRRV